MKEATMTVQDVTSKLFNELSSRPWFVSIGVGESQAGAVIYVYVKTLRHKELEELRSGYEGYPVVVERTGLVKISRQDRRQLALRLSRGENTVPSGDVSTDRVTESLRSEP